MCANLCLFCFEYMSTSHTGRKEDRADGNACVTNGSEEKQRDRNNKCNRSNVRLTHERISQDEEKRASLVRRFCRRAEVFCCTVFCFSRFRYVVHGRKRIVQEFCRNENSLLLNMSITQRYIFLISKLCVVSKRHSLQIFTNTIRQSATFL